MTDLPLFAHATRPKLSAQCERLLDYLRKHGPITPLDSWRMLGIQRLAARINDLRNAGYSIESKLVTVHSRFGDKCKVAEYRLS